MKKTVLFVIAAVALFATSCSDKKGKTGDDTPATDSIAQVTDTTVYGVCGESTTMSYLELKTSEGESVRYLLDTDSLYSPVRGGLLSGDRIAVTGHNNGEEMVADRVINLTTLLGIWSSIDKNFEIKEGGLVNSTVSESNKYTKWEIINGNLVLAPDTFSIYALGPDSLLLENAEGIYAFARLK